MVKSIHILKLVLCLMLTVVFLSGSIYASGALQAPEIPGEGEPPFDALTLTVTHHCVVPGSAIVVAEVSGFSGNYSLYWSYSSNLHVRDNTYTAYHFYRTSGQCTCNNYYKVVAIDNVTREKAVHYGSIAGPCTCCTTFVKPVR